MYDPTNPYASPMSTEMNPVAVQWLGTPSPSLLKVARGLGLIYSGICLALLSVIGGSVLVFVVGAATRSPEAVAMIGILMMIGVIVAWIMNIVGTLLCTATPEESGAQGMIYASAAAMGISLEWHCRLWRKDFGRSLGRAGRLMSADPECRRA